MLAWFDKLTDSSVKNRCEKVLLFQEIVLATVNAVESQLYPAVHQNISEYRESDHEKYTIWRVSTKKS